jgi:phosphohistidine swiveling domain-containing protein
MREGDEIVRNGRSGAFAFNLAAIKNHSIVVAAHVIERLELQCDDVARRAAADRCRTLAADESTRPAFEEAVSLEVRRLATRSPGRAQAPRRPPGSPPACHEQLPMPSAPTRHGHLMRAAVNQAAVKRLTDVSVTPRQLRRQLRITTDRRCGDLVTERRIRGVLLTPGTKPVVGGPCNRTGRPLEGSILVAPSLSPRLYDAIMAAGAVICSSGGSTGHMQSICRAKSIPVLRVDPADLDLLFGEVTLDLQTQSVIVGSGGNAGTEPRRRACHRRTISARPAR